jgi:UDP-N-acetylglucosamine--N-acetylmuramyl-(pentapeptide) pyrophosphoryl-undecaprenol N-acetylglucosamine transferase
VKPTRVKPTVVMATGGTGGHIYPAVAVARALTKRGCQVAFVGQRTGLEARLVPAEGLPFYGVRAGKWHRGRPDPRQAVQAVLGLRDAAMLLRQLRPALILGFGGFASFPALAAARVLGVPYALHEQNAYPGKVTRWFAKGARFVAAAQAEVGAHLPVRAEVVGMPVREQRLGKTAARRQLGLPETATVTLVMGGSQGSLVLNEAVPNAFKRLPESIRTGLRVLHSSGPAHVEKTRWHVLAMAAGLRLEAGRYRVDGYLESVLAWSAADLGISRAGTGTLAEAAFHGVPLIMVPLPSAAENHQLHNARAAEAAGAGITVEETALATLEEAWQTLLDPVVRQKMRAQARLRSPEGAGERLADLVERWVEGAVHPETHAGKTPVLRRL